MPQQDGTRNANVVLKSDNTAYNRAMDESAKTTNSVLASVAALTTGINHLAQSAGRGFQIIGTGTLAGLTAATVSAGKLESQLTSLHSSAVMSGRSLSVMDRQVNGLRGSLTITTDQTVALVTQLNKMGQGGAGVTKIATEFVKLGAVTGEAIGGLVDGMVSLQRQMGTEGPEYTQKFASSLATLSARAGVSAQSVLQFSNAIAPIGKVAGMTQTEIMGVSTAFSKSGEDGSRAANAFNTMLTDITRSIQYGSPHLQEYSNLLGVSVQQFKAMPKAEAVTEIFEKISKQGPIASKTLERFGLDGIRTYKSLQAVAASGGLRTALSDAAEGYQNNDKYNEASKQALAGLNDEMTKLGNNSTRVVQAFGQGLLPVFTELAKAINAVVSPFASLLESMGKVPGLAVAAGAGALVLGGSIVRSAAGLSTAALGATALKGTGAAGFRESSGFRNNWSDAATARRTSGAGSFTQRAMYDTGAMLGRPIGFMREQAAGERWASGMSVRERASRTVGAGIKGVGRFVSEGFSPLFHRNLQDPFNRTPMFSAKSGPYDTFTDSRAARNLTKSASVPNAMGSVGAAAEGMTGISKETKAAVTGIAGYNTALKALAIETGRVNLSMARASGGLTAAAGKLALSGLGKVGSGVMGLLGGPAGMAMTAGIGAFSLWQHQKGVHEGNLNTDVDTSSDKAAGSAYRTALGQAAEATTTFADIVKQNAHTIATPGDKGDYTGNITPQMASDATRLDVKYTDPRLGKMNESQASVYAQTAAVNGNKQQQQLLALDLTKRFGPAVAQRIMNKATDKDPTVDLASLASGINGRSGFFQNASQGAKDSASLYGATSKQSVASIQDSYGSTEAARFLTRSAGNLIKGGDTNSALKANTLAQMLGVSEGDKDARKQIESFLKKSQVSGVDENGLETKVFSASKSNQELGKLQKYDWAKQLTNARGMAGQSYDPFGSSWTANAALVKQNPVFAEAEANVQLRGTSVANTFLPSAGKPNAGVRDSWMSEAETNRAMPQGFDKHLSKTMETAISNEGDANAQARAVNELTDKVMQLNPNMSDAVLELAKFKGAAGATTSQLSLLSQAAMGRAMQLQEEQNFYKSSADQASGHAQNYENLKKYAASHPDAPQAEQDAEAARLVTVGDKQSAYNRAKSVVLGRRELDIGQGQQSSDLARQRTRATTAFNLQDSRAQADFALQRKQSDESLGRQTARTMRDFNLGRDRSLYQFNLSRSRGDENYTIQRQRGLRDFTLGQSRSLYQFNLSRSRSDEQFGIQQYRGLRDYTLGRQRAAYEFNLSRTRQEESYQRQLSRSLRDYNISRDRAQDDFNLQRSRQEEQYGIQLTRQIADYNLQRKRSQDDYNLSRRRQEEDFQHQVVLMTEQAARQIYNIYERINVKRTWSASNLLANAADQQKRITDQTQQLGQLRGAGVSGGVIKMLGLNESDNAQQLARFLDDVMADPQLVKKFNSMATDRTGAAGKIVTDKDNTAWEEMVRSFNLNQQRASDDFNKGMTRQADDFNKGLLRMREDYNRSLRQADADFQRSRDRQSADFARGLKDQRTEYNIQVRNAADDFARQRTQQGHDFNQSITDMRSDYARQVRQSNTDFATQRAQQGHDFNQSMSDMRKDYGKQVRQANTDFALQRAQQLTDLHTQLSDQRDEYKISMDQSAANFARARKRQQTDFQLQMAIQVTEFAIQQARALSTFNRSQEELTGSLNDIAMRGSKALTGNSKKQFDAYFKALGIDGTKAKKAFKDIGDGITTMFKDWGIPYRDGQLGSAQANAKHAEFAGRAEGGTIPGHSPHSKADNVLIRATAGEFMHPVDAVKYYGTKTMEALRTRSIPKEALDAMQGLAEGGAVTSRASLVAFGHRLQKMGFQVGENPSFGGVTPGVHLSNALGGWHYRSGAIDVNHDQGGERAALDSIMPLAKALGFGIHWLTRNHFDHAHFDIGAWSAYGNNNTVRNAKIGSVGGSAGVVGGVGMGSEADILKQIKAMKGTKDWETLRASRKYLSGIAKDALAKALAHSVANGMGGGTSDGSGDLPGPHSTVSGTAQKYAQSQLGKYGWGMNQFPPLQSLWNRESNWRWDARSASSGAYGIPQSLPGNKMATAGSDWRTNPATQIDWGLEYIKGRYGAPSGAWAHSQRTNWYGDGAVFNSPRQIGVGDRGPEAVLPLNQKGADFMHAVLSRYNDSSVSKANLHSIPSASKNITYYSRVDNSTTYTGNISVASNDPREFMQKMEAQKRMKALIGRKP